MVLDTNLAVQALLKEGWEFVLDADVSRIHFIQRKTRFKDTVLRVFNNRIVLSEITSTKQIAWNMHDIFQVGDRLTFDKIATAFESYNATINEMQLYIDHDTIVNIIKVATMFEIAATAVLMKIIVEEQNKLYGKGGDK